MFDTLLSVQGVGGRIAIALLSEFSEDDLYHILLNENKRALCKVSGIGDRLASRIVSELKHKIAKMDFKEDTAVPFKNNVFDDVRSALLNLGYANADINIALSDSTFTDVTEFNQLLKFALRKLSGATK